MDCSRVNEATCLVTEDGLPKSNQQVNTLKLDLHLGRLTYRRQIPQGDMPESEGRTSLQADTGY